MPHASGLAAIRFEPASPPSRRPAPTRTRWLPQRGSAERSAAPSLPGWDSHRGRPRQIRRALEKPRRGFLSLQDGLGRDRDRTVVPG
jgi:hypothetical protein